VVLWLLSRKHSQVICFTKLLRCSKRRNAEVARLVVELDAKNTKGNTEVARLVAVEELAVVVNLI
jgi:hypothetical protein